MEKEIDGMLLAQNKEQFEGATVFHLPFTGGSIVKMMSFKDVQHIVDRIRASATSTQPNK